MRIAFDHQIFSFQQYGGVSRYFVRLASELNDLWGPNAHIRILAPLSVNRYLNESSVPVKLNTVSIKYFRGVGHIVKPLNSILAHGHEFFFKPDVIHETYYSQSVRSNLKAKRVITVYDMIHELFPQHFSRNDPTASAKRAAVNRADHIICISESTKRDLIQLLDIDSEKVSVVHLGFSPFSSSKPVERINFPRPFLLYVGSRTSYKNFGSVLSAYAKSKLLHGEFDLVVFGGRTIQPSERDVLLKHGVKHGCLRRVSGDDALLARFYEEASAFVYPSIYEGFGIPPLEAMASGCPVVCSNTSSIPEVVGSAALLFNPHCLESISEALHQIVYDEAIREQLVLRGYERAKAFSWLKCASETSTVYRSLM